MIFFTYFADYCRNVISNIAGNGNWEREFNANNYVTNKIEIRTEIKNRSGTMIKSDIDFIEKVNVFQYHDIFRHREGYIARLRSDNYTLMGMKIDAVLNYLVLMEENAPYAFNAIYCSLKLYSCRF